MREIKFRYFDKDFKIYRNIVSINFSEKRLYYKDGVGFLVSDIIDNFIIDQYTGLKDKNGVEIYEGDKITLLDENEEENGSGYVEWLENFGFWNVSGIEEGLGDLKFNNYLVVTGNINEEE